MACPQSIGLLEQIADNLKQIMAAIKYFAEPKSVYQRNENGWTIRQVGKDLFYERIITYSAAATLTLNLPTTRSFQINRIEQIWVAADGITPDATAKDISIRLYSDIASPIFSELKSVSGDTNTDMFTIPTFESELKMTPTGMLQFYYANYTATHKVKIVVVITEL